MVNEQRKIVAVLTLIGTIAGVGFAIYNCYLAFNPNNTVALKKTA